MADEQNKLKRSKAAYLSLWQNIAEFLAITFYGLFTIIFLIALVLVSLKAYHDRWHWEQYVKEAIGTFEWLFIAPIPSLVIYAFRATMVKIYPACFNDPDYDEKNMLTIIDAKKNFVSSIAGVTGIYIVGQFLLEGKFDNDMFIKTSLAMVFLVILIIYYHILSGHDKK
jgi:hypothetical protein